MRNTLRAVQTASAVVCLCGVAWVGSATESADDGATVGVEITSVLKEIQAGLDAAQIALASEASTDFPRLAEVKLTLQTTTTRSKGARIRVFFFGFGGSSEKVTTNQLEVVLAPVPPAHRVKAGDRSTLGVRVPELLKSAIVAAATGVRDAAMKDPTSGQPLALKRVSTTIRFVVEKGGSADAEFTILPVTVELSGKTKAAETQELKLVFEGR